jgi:hypothetical protein
LGGSEKTENRDDGKNANWNFHANASRGQKEPLIKTIELYGLCGLAASSFGGIARQPGW